MYRKFWLCLALVPFKLLAEPLSITVQAESAILVNADTGAILYEKNAHALQYPASITKIATAAYALKKAGNKLDTIVVADHDAVASISEETLRRSNYTLPAYWLTPGGSHIGIKKGEELSLRDLLYGMMIASGNDASNVVAHHIGGTIPNYITEMNAYLKEVGCKNTTFYNPHGLHHPKHQTTAYDMAVMTIAAMKNPTFREIVSTVRYTRPKTNKQSSTTLLQTNRLLRKGKLYYAKAIGVKTGYLSLAGNTLVGAAKQDNRTLIAVLLKSKEREEMFRDATNLFEKAFNQPKVNRVLLKAGPQKFTLDVKGAQNAVSTYTQEEIALSYYPAEEPKLKCLLYWNTVTPPIAKDQIVGELHMQTPEGQIMYKVPLLAQEKVSSTWLWAIQHMFGNGALKWAAGGLAIFVIAGVFVVSNKRI